MTAHVCAEDTAYCSAIHDFHAVRYQEKNVMKVSARIKMGSVLLFLATPALTYATSAYRASTVSEIQSSAATGSPATRLTYIAQRDGSTDVQWSQSTTCPTAWAYFDAATNPHLAAIAIAAQMSDKVLRVYVDDALPKVGGYCQIAHLSLLPD